LALGTAVVVRVISLLLVANVQWSDFACYDEMAWDWAQKGGYYNGEHPTGYWPPAHPFFLSRLYLVFGHHILAGLVANIVFGAITVWLSYMIARRVWNESVARWTALIMALLPSQVLFTNLLASEHLFTPLFLTSVLLFITFRDRLTGRWQRVLIGGLCLGLATLARPVSKLFLAVIIAWWIWQSRDIRRTVKYSLVALFAFAVVVAPWMARNYYVMGTATVSTNTGINLFIGNQPGSGMGYNTDLALEYDVNNPLMEAYIDSAAWSRAWDYIFEEPGQFVKRGVMKVAFFYAVDLDPLHYDLLRAAEEETYNHSIPLAVFVQSFYLVLLLTAAAGIVLCLVKPSLRKPEIWPLLGAIVYWTGICFFFFATSRFRLPIFPFLAGFAAVYIKMAVDKLPPNR
ncbi:MAG: glycosyltransferase family 39 protein, partial [Candidatus Zixiibacteriota bacterium]